MTTHRSRTVDRPPSRARVWLLRTGSLLLVLLVAVGTYVAVNRAERQECINSAYARSLDERGRAIDALIEAISSANDRLAAATDREDMTAAREQLDAALIVVRETRDNAKRRAELEAEGADCG